MEANTRALPAAARFEISTPARLMAVKLAGQSRFQQRDPVRTEGVGHNHLASGFHVGAGHRFHALGTLQVPGVGQSARRQPEDQQLGAPRSVGDQWTLRQPLLKFTHIPVVPHSATPRWLLDPYAFNRKQKYFKKPQVKRPQVVG